MSQTAAPNVAFIFDCDGTLVNSTPVWAYAQPELLHRHGVEVTVDDFAQFEHLSLEDECQAYHDTWGIGENGEELYRELSDILIDGYSRVPPREGLLAFLEQAKAAGIVMCVATSTPAELVKSALAGAGLDAYMEFVTTTGEAGRSKQFPDVYELALRRLEERHGHKFERAWVFEDAVFGLKSSGTAGFKRVGIYDPLGRMEREDVRDNCDIFVDSYEELDLDCVLAYEGWARAVACKVLVVCGSPVVASTELLRRLAGECDHVVAVDRGLDALLGAGLGCDVYVGDADTVSDAGRALVDAATDFEVERHDPYKDYTDLALALDSVRRRWPGAEVVATCATGGRPDMALSVLGLLAGYDDAPVWIAEDETTARILHEGESWTIEGVVDKTFSIIAIAPGTVVSERGLEWELDHSSLSLLADTGISNIVRTTANITVHQGTAIGFLLA